MIEFEVHYEGQTLATFVPAEVGRLIQALCAPGRQPGSG